MEVKPGYKQTEVGVIPEEWRAVARSATLRSDVDGAYELREPSSQRRTFDNAGHLADRTH